LGIGILLIGDSAAIIIKQIQDTTGKCKRLAKEKKGLTWTEGWGINGGSKVWHFGIHITWPGWRYSGEVADAV
jgi:hypothetical protein